MRDVIVMGGSAGGLQPVIEIIRGLPRDFRAPIFLVMHRPASQDSALDQILDRAGALTADFASDGESIRDGRIYVAPSDLHMIVEKDRIRLTNGPKENRFRPAIDPLFRSAAYVYGANAIGVILSGALDDGTAGLWWIKYRGGTAIVQDPETAIHSSMPESALANVSVDYALRPGAIAEALVGLTNRRARRRKTRSVPKDLETEVQIARGREPLAAGLKAAGEVSEFTCPECGGALLKVRKGKPLRFRCHTGHAFSRESLLESVNDSVETAVWNTIRDIGERVRYLRLLAAEARLAGDAELAKAYAREANQAERDAEAIRKIGSKA